MKKPGKKKVILIIGILAGALVLTGAALWFLLGGGFGSAGTEVYVTPVGQITNLGSGTGLLNRYAGVVETQELTEINIGEGKTLGKLLVKEGDPVQVGTPLFTYDMASLELSQKQMQLEYDEILMNIATMESQIETLEKEQKSASRDDQLAYTVEIQTLELSIKQENYSLQKKKLELDAATAALKDNSVTSPIEGKVKSINMAAAQGETQQEGGDYMMGTDAASAPFIALLATGDIRVKATVSEQSVHLISEGMPMLIRSRVDDKTWTGTVESVNMDQPNSQEQDGIAMDMYGSSMGERASKYPFYIQLADSNGLMIGQHVYVEPDLGQNQSSEGIWIPDYYVVQDPLSSYVFAENSLHRIEKRTVAIGDHDTDTGYIQILSGLSMQDRIAFPDGTVTPGAKAVSPQEESFEDMGDMGMADDMVYDGAVVYEDSAIAYME